MAKMNKKGIIGIIGGILLLGFSAALGVTYSKKHASDKDEVVVTDYEECAENTAKDEDEAE